MNFNTDLAFARQLDKQDSLQVFRKQFHIPKHNGKEVLYFTGNSLGLQPKTAKLYLQQELHDWAMLGVEGHVSAQNPWVSYHEQFAEPLAALVGAAPEEVVAMNQLTLNLHVLLTTFYRPTKERFKIICEAKAFPSDQYAFESQVRLHGFDPAEAIIEVAPRKGEHHIQTEDILTAIETHRNSVSVVLFSGVNYYTGQVFDMQKITGAAHAAGAYAGFDLAHAIGNIPLRLHEWNADFATWCSYKYLNSGPGGVSGVFINKKHVLNANLPRLAGWWGTNKATRFQMQPDFDPIPTAEGWQLSNAPVLSMAVHKASLDIFMEAGLENLHAKSKQLTGYLFFLLDELNKNSSGKIIEIITPRDAHGCQVSMLMLQKGKEIFQALREEGVVADWREPNVIRIAPVPLYNRFEDAWNFADIVRRFI